MPDIQVRVYEEKETIGGACKTEYPFPRVPGLGTSTGALFKFNDLHCACQLSRCFTFQGYQLQLSKLVPAGAYLLGVMPPELLSVLGIKLPLLRRDPWYFLPTTGKAAKPAPKPILSGRSLL